ncbi:DNA repair exonuclease SbcCD nuclease subunit [Planomicrobium soli]|uniref:DNA repair exonuclease SbcCD nuclease subunit n=1 Tax=Planomicrobium soli TaxID=1176648 RepID=A0A2P8G9G7_9BACL|nr:DNA repair exonuclease [Planomicrobium soli]PSL30622.1 DNA repair exonuclease SbcCD nuclease subunit [Planomicrobium soli]
MGQIRFIHAADLHLGSPFTGMKGLQKEQWKKLKDSTMEAFDQLVDYAVAERPDFLLIVGDIYDGEDRSLRAQHRFQLGMKRLKDAKIPVVVSYGNHDHLSGKWSRFELPENVHVFGPAVSQMELSTENGDVIITGFSYRERHIKESMISAYPPAEKQETFHIGMLHGSMEGNTAHAVYAPFTKEQLLSKNYDYWALGHIHMRQELHREPSIVYSGNIQGRHMGETGQKGFYDVMLSKTETKLSFVPASVVQFDRLVIPCGNIMHMNEVLEACREGASDYAGRYGAAVIELEFTGIHTEAAELFNEIPEIELIETIREAIEGDGEFVWIHSLAFEESGNDLPISPFGEQIIGVIKNWDTNEWKEALNDLYRHPKGSRFLHALDSETIEDFREGAVQKIRRSIQIGE